MLQTQPIPLTFRASATIVDQYSAMLSAALDGHNQVLKFFHFPLLRTTNAVVNIYCYYCDIHHSTVPANLVVSVDCYGFDIQLTQIVTNAVRRCQRK